MKSTSAILLICMQHTAQAAVENMQFTGNKNQHGHSKQKSLKSLLKILDDYIFTETWYIYIMTSGIMLISFHIHFTGKRVEYGLNKGISHTN